jgi:DNA-directed RNA polymerase specialized sigma24 family protein
VPLGTVRSRLARARHALQEVDQAEGHEPDELPHTEETAEG